MRRRAFLSASIAAVAVFGVGVCWSYPVPVGPQFRVNAFATGLQSDPDVAATGADGFVVVWTDWSARDGAGFGIFGRRVDASGVPIGGDFAINAWTTGLQATARVAADAAGNFVVAWSDFSGHDGNGYGVVARRFDAAGAPVGGEFIVNSQTVGNQVGPAIAMDAAGNFLVAWVGGDGGGYAAVKARRFDASAAPQGVEFQVNSTPQSYAPRLAVDAGGDFAVVWFTAAGAIEGRRLDGNGLPIGVPFSWVAGAYLGGVDVGSDAAGNLAVVWSELDPDSEARHDVFGRLVSSGGVPVGSEFQVNTYTTGNQSGPHVAMSATGDFVVSFDSPRGYEVGFSNGYSAEGRSIDARRFDASGAPVGPEFRVNTASARLDIAESSIDLAPSGEFLVVWDVPPPPDLSDIDDIGGRFFGALVPMSAAKVLIKDDPTNATKRKIVVRAPEQQLSTHPGAGVNPLADGAYLHVYNTAGTGDSACLPLPSAHWSVTGDDPERPKYKYKDGLAASGPCAKVSVAGGALLKATCKAALEPIAYTLDEPQQGSVAVRFVSGGVTYCALLDGAAVVTDDGTEGKFLARNAAAPAACPVPPSPCP